MAVINIVVKVLSLSINSIRCPTRVGFSLADKQAKKDFAANTLAYFTPSSVTKKTSFINFPPDRDVSAQVRRRFRRQSNGKRRPRPPNASACLATSLSWC